MLNKSQIVSSIVVLLILLTKIIHTIADPSAATDDHVPLLKQVTKQVNKKFDVADSDQDCAQLVSKFNNLKQRLKQVVAGDKNLIQLSLIKQELTSLVAQDQWLIETAKLAEELVLQKNATKSFGHLLKKTDATYKEEKAVLQAAIKNLEQHQKQLETEKQELIDEAIQKAATEEQIKLALLDERKQLAEKLYHAYKRIKMDNDLIKKDQDDDLHDATSTYTHLKAESGYFKARGDYFKILCDEAQLQATEREKHRMSVRDKKTQREYELSKPGATAKVQAKFNYVNARIALDQLRAKSLSLGSTQLDDDLDPDLQAAIRLSKLGAAPAATTPGSSNAGSSSDHLPATSGSPLRKDQIEAIQLQEAIRLSQAAMQQQPSSAAVATAPVATSKPQQDSQDADLQEAIRLSNLST